MINELPLQDAKPFWHDLPFVRLAYRYLCQEELRLPSYKGSALRGAFGHALRKVTCALRQADCQGCLLRHQCVYIYVFETPPPPDSQRLRRYPTAPHPFVIRPPADEGQEFFPGMALSGELLLIGRAVEYLPYFVYAFEVMGQEGLGRGRSRVDLVDFVELDALGQPGDTLYQVREGVLQAPQHLAWQQCRSPAAIEAAATDLTLTFLTPVRLKAEGRMVEQLEFHHVIRNLLRRLASLAYFHGGIDPETFPFKEAIRLAEQVPTVSRRLRWLDWERYSSRQRTKMLMGGLVGQITFAQVPGVFLSLLATGSHLHVGKMASFGLGRYELSFP